MLPIDKLAYYKTKEWKLKADECKQLAGNICSMCSTPYNLHAHHLTYDRLGAELQSDLQCLCVDCHEKVHDMTPGTLRNRKNIRGGFRMVYKSYDDALLSIVKSTKDLELVIFIRDMFTYMQVEANLSTDYLQKKTGLAKSKITEVISRMVTSKLLHKVRRGVYRLNPYMYLPYKADSELLQAEWLKLTKDNQ